VLLAQNADRVSASLDGKDIQVVAIVVIMAMDALVRRLTDENEW
jgi:hypothetical protein